MSERNRERAKKWLKEHAGDIWPVPAADSFTALLDAVEQQARAEGYEEAREQAAQLGETQAEDIRDCAMSYDRDDPGSPRQSLMRERSGILGFLSAIRAMKPGRG